MKFLISLVLVIVAVSLCVVPVRAQSDTAKAAVAEAPKFDPGRNAEEDIKAGVAEAKRTNRHVLLDVGGEWCIWCHRLDAFFSDNPDVGLLMKKNYVVVKVNYSKENKNEQVLSQYPKVSGYPHLFVLDETGKLLHSQNTGELEAGKGYDKSKIIAFLKAWGVTHAAHPAPDFTLKTSDGKTIEMKKLLGKAVVVNFWATWCGPCRREIPGMIEVYEKYKEKGLEIVGISVGEEWKLVKPFVEMEKISYPVVIADNDLFQAYGGKNSIPTTAFVDREGNIVSLQVGALPKEDFEKMVLSILK